MPTGLDFSQCTSTSLDIIFYPLGSSQMALNGCVLCYLVGVCHWKCLSWLFDLLERESESYMHF